MNAIIDGGAYHGLVSKQLLSLFPNAIVYAFEPQKESFSILEYNVKDTPNIKPISLALSSSTGTRKLYVTDKRYSSSLSPVGAFGVRYYQEETRLHCIETIDVISLDEWSMRVGVPCVDIIKLDIQGHELDALLGGVGLLKSTVRVIYTEVEFIELYDNNCLYFQLETFLREQGYRLYQLYNLQTGQDGQLIYGDAIFINHDRVAL